MSEKVNILGGVTITVVIAASISVGILYNQVAVLADDTEHTRTKLMDHQRPSTHASNQKDHEAILILQNDLDHITEKVEGNSDKLDQILEAVRD